MGTSDDTSGSDDPHPRRRGPDEPVEPVDPADGEAIRPDELAGLDQWDRVAPDLRLRLRPSDDRHWGPTVGPWLRAELVVERRRLLVPVTQALVCRWGRSASTLVATAAANTSAQPLRMFSSSVTAGPDAGSRIVLIAGGPCTSGITADLGRVLPSVRLPALVTVPEDRIVMVGLTPDGADRASSAALAARLASLGWTAGTLTPAERRLHRRILWCRGPGRLSIFDPEDR